MRCLGEAEHEIIDGLRKSFLVNARFIHFVSTKFNLASRTKSPSLNIRKFIFHDCQHFAFDDPLLPRSSTSKSSASLSVAAVHSE